MNDTSASGKVISIPQERVMAIGASIIVKDTNLFCLGDTTESGFIIPEKAGDRKYGIGEVVAKGPLVKEVGIGDILVFQLASGAGMDAIPNGMSKPVLFKTLETSLALVCRISAEDVAAEKARLNPEKHED